MGKHEYCQIRPATATLHHSRGLLMQGQAYGLTETSHQRDAATQTGEEERDINEGYAFIDDTALYAETHEVSSEQSLASDDEQPSQITDVSPHKSNKEITSSDSSLSCIEASAIESVVELSAAGEMYLTVIECSSD